MRGGDSEVAGGLTRGELAKRIGKSIATVRRLEQSGVLQPKKDQNGVHRFGPADVEQAKAAVGSGPVEEDDAADGPLAVRRIARDLDGPDVDGPLAADAFRLLEEGYSPIEVVEQLGISPAVARRLVRDYQDLKRATMSSNSLDAGTLERDFARLSMEVAQLRDALAPLMPLARQLAGDLRCLCGHQHSLGALVACTFCGQPGALKLG